MAHPTHRQPPPLAMAALIATAIVCLQALLVPLFAAPSANLAPRHLPVVVAGPAPVVQTVTDRLAAAQLDGFEVSTVADGAAADQALRQREAYAAFVAGSDGLSLHVASGASPAVAALLTAAVQQLGQGQQVRVVDVVPSDPDDPRGAGFAAGFLPLALAALLAGAALALRVPGRLPRLVGLLVFGALAGLVGAAVLRDWLGVVPGDYVRDAAAIGLFALATAASTAGLGALLGRAGVGLGLLLVFLVGNPLSAVAAAPELLPEPWGAVGQWLPVGAGATLLRSTAYFDGAGGDTASLVLSAWAVVGLALVLLGRSGRGTLPAAEADSARDAVRRLGLSVGVAERSPRSSGPAETQLGPAVKRPG